MDRQPQFIYRYFKFVYFNTANIELFHIKMITNIQVLELQISLNLGGY